MTDSRKQYGPAAESALVMSVAEIRGIAKEPMEEVAAVILLDQIPRNIYRGSEAKKVHLGHLLVLCFGCNTNQRRLIQATIQKLWN